MNFSRAGTFSNSRATRTVVPSGAAAADFSATTPPRISIRAPSLAPRVLLVISNSDTDAMLGSASPRKPYVAIAARSSVVRILEVAWR